jgi:hypothetical protein
MSTKVNSIGKQIMIYNKTSRTIKSMIGKGTINVFRMRSFMRFFSESSYSVYKNGIKPLIEENKLVSIGDQRYRINKEKWL